MADPEQTPAATPYIPPSRRSDDMIEGALAKALQEEGIVPSPEATPTPAKTEAVPAEPKTEPQKSEEPALLKLAREKAAKRQAEQAAKPQNDLLAAFTPQEAERIAQARKAGDPVAALRALGFDHTQYTKALLNMKEEQPEEKAAPEPSSDVAALKAEVERLKQEREQERFQVTRSQTLGQMKTMLKDDSKFSYINALEALDGVEGVLLDYHRQFGDLPGSNFEESVKLAAEVYEARLRSGDVPLTKKQWERIQGLTTPASSAPVPTKAPESQPSAGTDTPRTLTNSNTTAPAAVKSVLKTRGERLAALSEGRLADLE